MSIKKHTIKSGKITVKISKFESSEYPSPKSTWNEETDTTITLSVCMNGFQATSIGLTQEALQMIVDCSKKILCGSKIK